MKICVTAFTVDRFWWFMLAVTGIAILFNLIAHLPLHENVGKFLMSSLAIVLPVLCIFIRETILDCEIPVPGARSRRRRRAARK